MKTYKVTVDDYKTIRWYNEKGQYHREGGPAIEYTDGTKLWYINDQLHREDGPAIEYADGRKAWLINGQYHRVDGPAIEGADGTKEWYINGKMLTEKAFKARTKKNKPCNPENKVVEIDGKRYKLVKMS